MDYDSEKKRRERQHRRKLISDWKAEAKAIQAADFNKRMLLREVKQASLKRIEDAARTEADFENVSLMWNDREIVETWRVAKHEELTLSGMWDYELRERDTVIPQPLNHIWWRQLLAGSFLDVIHDCPHELHEMTTNRPIFDFMMDLDDNHKEILYYWAIRQWTPQMIAAFRGQTDRNIRKVYNTMIDNIRLKMYLRLRPRCIANEPLTFTQQEFCRTYWEQLDETQKGRLTRKFEDEERRRRKTDRRDNRE